MLGVSSPSRVLGIAYRREAHEECALILCLALLAASPSFADDMPVNANGLTWGPAPPVLPKRRSARRVIGRSRKGRTLCSAFEDTGELQDSSSQSSDGEYVTVISGEFHIRMGNKLDEKKEVELRAEALVQRPLT